MASRILYRQDGAGTSHENTTDEAVIGSYQIPARFLAKGKTLRWQGSVWVEDNNSTDTLTIDLKVGTVALTGTDVHTSGAIDVADNDVMFWDLIVEPRSAAGSASGDVLVHGTATILGAIGTVTSRAVYKVLSSVNYEAALFLAATADWSVAHADNEAECASFIVLEDF